MKSDYTTRLKLRSVESKLLIDNMEVTYQWIAAVTFKLGLHD